jgi:hypothetical protein
MALVLSALVLVAFVVIGATEDYRKQTARMYNQDEDD